MSRRAGRGPISVGARCEIAGRRQAARGGGAERGADNRLAHHVRRQGADAQDVRLPLTFAGGQREDRVAIGRRVDGRDGAGEAVVGHLGYLARLRLGQRRVGGDDAERGVLAGAGRERRARPEQQPRVGERRAVGGAGAAGALQPWNRGVTAYWRRLIAVVAEDNEVDLDMPWPKLKKIRERDLPRRHRRRTPPGQLHEPLWPPPLLQSPLRGDRQQPRAPLRRDRLGDEPRADRELHGRAALPRLQGARLRPESLAVKVGGISITGFSAHLSPRRGGVDRHARDEQDRARGRAPRARASPRSAAGRSPAGRPAGIGPALAIVTRSSTSRSRSRRGSPRRPAAALARPTSRLSSARSLSSATIRRSSASIRRRSRRSSAVSPRGRAGQPSASREPPRDRLERQQVAARALPDDRLERDVVEEVDLPERLARRRIGQVDLDERPLRPRAARRAARRRCGSARRR